METIIASGPVIIEDGKVLLDKNATDPFWKFPGGKWEPSDLNDEGHSLEAVARRKVKEELGLEIEILKPLKPMMLKKDDAAVVVLIHWLARRIGEIVPGEHTTKWAWHDIHALPADCAPNIKPVIEDYLNNVLQKINQ